MEQASKQFKKVVVLDTVIFYPEHRSILRALAREVVEYPSSLPANLEKQYRDNPELFLEQKCYTQIASDNIPLQLLMQRVEGADVIISCWTDIPDEILRLNPQLKLIVFWTHEKEHRINVQLANELGITVENIPDYGTDAVAEVVFAGMWQLILRNFAAPLTDGQGTMHAIVDYVFRTFRRLGENEKNTRAGKFTHHFHKIGAAKFDFTQKNIDELIPERLVAFRRVGLLDLTDTEPTCRVLHALGVVVDVQASHNDRDADFYKFLSENEIVFYDSRRTGNATLRKMLRMFPKKLVDIHSLSSATYSFAGKTFGVIGLGRIGRLVAATAKKLGFTVVYSSLTPDPKAARELGIECVSLEELMARSDVISLHVPAHKAEKLLTAELIAHIKPGTLFINTADGNALDQHALTKRMASGEIFAYLDVYPGLPRKDVLGLPMADPADWKLHKILPNNVLAYRAGWKTQESIRVKTYKLIGHMIDALQGA